MHLENPVLGSVTQSDFSFACLSQYLIVDLPIVLLGGFRDSELFAQNASHEIIYELL
jgi:hypothetical protein